MSFPKPEYIQNFIDEKLKKGDKTEKTSLMEEDSLARESEEMGRSGKSYHNTSSETRRKMNGSSGESPAFSESDDQARRKRVGLNGKSTGSESDLDTDDSAVLARAKQKNGQSTAPIQARHKHKKAKDVRTPLRGADNHATAYGGTSEVNLDTAETLASYSPSNGVKGILKAGRSNSKQGNELLVSGSSPHKSRSSRERRGNAGNNDGDSSTSDDHVQSYGLQVPHSSSHNHGGFQSDVESEHCHDSSDERSEIEQKKRNRAMRKLLIATGLSFLFMVGEVVGGYLANSLAIMTDASHLLTDVSSFLISIIALKMAARPISKKMTFGWHRAEVIGALISVLAIWVVTAVLVYLAVMRLITKKYTVNGETMLITASCAVGFNIVMGLVLHEAHGHSHGHNHSHGHSHGDNHDHDHEAGSTASSSDDIQSSGNVNVRAAFIHVIGDLLQSLGVLVAAFIIYFKPEYKIADPICTFLFSILVLITTITILRDTVIVIMEGSPVGIEYNVVKEKLLEIEGVTAVHDLRIWSLTLNQTVMSAHLAIDKGTDSSHVLKQATRRLKSLYDFHSLTIQVEYYSVDMDDCKKCQPA